MEKTARTIFLFPTFSFVFRPFLFIKSSICLYSIPTCVMMTQKLLYSYALGQVSRLIYIKALGNTDVVGE